MIHKIFLNETIAKKILFFYFTFRKIKMLWYRQSLGLKNVSPSFYMGGKSSVSKDFIADDFSFIGSNCLIGPKVKIGRFSMLANNVSIVGSDHLFSDPKTPIIFSGRPILKETVIGEDVWIGAFSIILSGINIGDGSIIGAGSVITKNIPPYSVYAGVPARFIKMRFTEIEIEIHKKMLKGKHIDVKYCKDKD